MTNYIGKIEAEWVDPAVELPEEGWYTVRWHSGQVATSSFDGQKWGYPSVSAWLRIGGPSTDIPREQAQKAVDELVASEVPSDCECPTCDAIRAMCKAIGVTPTEGPQ